MNSYARQLVRVRLDEQTRLRLSEGTTLRCPLHDQTVGVTPEGRLLGRCWRCMEEAAEAIAVIEAGLAA